jgi:hypothetical protein
MNARKSEIGKVSKQILDRINVKDVESYRGYRHESMEEYEISPDVV